MANLPDLVNVDYFSDIGDGVARAVTKSDARDAIGADRGYVDLRDWDAIRDGSWKTSNGVTYTSGQTTLTGTTTPFTAADIGNVIVVKNDIGGYWMANIVDVSDGVAEIDIPCPFSVSVYGQRASWGSDITSDLNDALSDIASAGEIKSVFLSGIYRGTQIVIPDYIIFSGAGWGDYQAFNAGAKNGLRLWQLPGSECDFVVFNPTNPASGSHFFGPVVLRDMNLQGPERTVSNGSVTVGHGLAFATSSGQVLSSQDGVQLINIQSAVFPQSGFKINGGVPTLLTDCRTWYNSEYGIDVVSRYAGACQMTHLLNYSADGNNLGAVRFKDLVSYDSVVITGLKSEYGAYGTEGDPGYQYNCVVFEDCDDTGVTINGLSHINGYPFNTTNGAGPAITINSDSGKTPRIVYSGVSNRVSDVIAEADSLDSVTIRDNVAGVDVPRTVGSGVYPLGASTCGHSSETVTDVVTIGYFTDHTVFIGAGGQPELPAAVGRPGARCKFINVTDGDVTAVIDGGVVALLCGDDQADTSTTITDTSLLAADWTAHGSAQIDTSVKKYGAGSIQFDGVNSYITATAAVENFTFGIGDFTIECWLYLGTIDFAQFVFDFREYGTFQQVVPTLVWNSGSSNELRYITDNETAITGPALSATTWYHIALCRAGNKTRLFVDGTQVGDTLADTNDYLCSTTGPSFGINSYNLTGPFTGRMDDIRISTIARYISDFTPPGKAAEVRTALLGAEASVTAESDGSEWRLS